MAVKKGDKVRVEYTGTLDDGSVFDASEKHGAPLEYEAGSGQIIPGLDKAVIGMEVGEKKDVTIPAADAYGEPNPQLVKKIPREQIPMEQEPQAGMMLMITLPNRHQTPVLIKEVTDSEITLDLNHPLAGKTLHFKVKVVGVE